MPIIRVPQLQKQIEVPVGTNLMKALQGAQIPVASSCLGDGVCAKCRVRVSHPEALSKPNATEEFLQQKFKLQPLQRISCQSEVQDDIEVETSYW